MAVGGIQPGAFDKFILQAAGQRAAGQGGGKPLTPRDQATAEDSVNTAYDARNEGAAPGAAPSPDAGVIKATATHIMLNPQNRQNNVTRDEAVGTAASMVDPTQQGQVKPTDGGVLVKFGNNAPVFVPQDQFDSLQAVRAQKIQAAKAAKDKADADAKKPGFFAGAAKAISSAPVAPMPTNTAPATGPAYAGQAQTTPMFRGIPQSEDYPEDPNAVPGRGLGER